MDPIGPPLTRVGDDQERLAFRHRGSFGGIVQAAFIAVLAGVTYVIIDPIFGYLNAALAVALLLGAIGSGVSAWDLTLDARSRTWELRRGYRSWQRRVCGSFDDFTSVTLAAGRPEGWWICLVPRGSERGYLIEEVGPRRGRAAVEALWRDYAARLGVPAAEERPAPRPEDAPPSECDIAHPPEGGRIVVRPWRGGYELDVTPYRRVWKEIVRVTPEGLEIVRRLRTPFGSSDATRRLPWTAIGQIIVAPLIYGTWESGDPKAWWRVRPDWRANMRELWVMRCHELKLPVRPLPWWGYLWYFIVEGHWRRLAKAVMVFSRGGAPEQLGDDSRLRPEDIRWLCGALIARHRACGGPPLEEG